MIRKTDDQKTRRTEDQTTEKRMTGRTREGETKTLLRRASVEKKQLVQLDTHPPAVFRKYWK